MDNDICWHFFLSYNWGENNMNIKKVRKIHDELKANFEAKIWWDQVELKGGDWRKQVSQAIRNCKIFICFITREYAKSPNCMDELSIAKNLNNI